MSPELIAILGVGVALTALMFHILRRMEERMRQDTQRSEERTRQDLSRSEERTRQDIRESEERMRQEVQGSEERTRQDIRGSEERMESRFSAQDARFTSHDGRFTVLESRVSGHRGANGKSRRASRRPLATPLPAARPPESSPAPSGQDARRSADDSSGSELPEKRFKFGHAVTTTASVPFRVTSLANRETGSGCTPWHHRS